MHIHKISVKNFRLLSDVSLSIEQGSTTIVGRNNSGKTSLTELFRRVLSEKVPTFRFEDFSQSAHDGFWKAYRLRADGATLQEVRAALPVIELKWIEYDVAASDLGSLGDLVIDLDPNCNEAILRFRYQLKDGAVDELLRVDIDTDTSEADQRSFLCHELKERIGKCFAAVLTAVDPGDSANTKDLEWSLLANLLRGSFINAQRGLDDITHKDRDVLGKILSALLGTAMSASADASDQSIAAELKLAVKEIQEELDAGFSTQLTKLLPAFELFGYPGFSDPGLRTETTLDVERLLIDNTRISYAGANGIALPESYNGLGARNLIFILLKLLEFYKSFMALPATPAVHLVFVEEPEVHLHPQMQEVFITQLSQIARVFAEKFDNGIVWPVQFIITTHSSHIANRAPFDAIRYFFATPVASNGDIRTTTVKDLGKGLSDRPAADIAFLHKYMTLTRCDLLFADKAVLIEGATERLLLPAMLRKVDATNPSVSQLSSQYISVVEVGGAHAHLFFPLVEFLELPTLVVTDLDSVNDSNSRSACLVSKGTHTSNSCLKEWFSDTDIAPTVLIGMADDKKVHGMCRIAFQVPEADDGPCGRSFEDAFVLANETLFAIDSKTHDMKAEAAWNIAGAVQKKSDFALQYAIERDDWVVPRYIKQGLDWLRAATFSRPSTSSTAPTPVGDGVLANNASHA